jgi:hypothetical protein
LVWAVAVVGHTAVCGSEMGIAEAAVRKADVLVDWLDQIEAVEAAVAVVSAECPDIPAHRN